MDLGRVVCGSVCAARITAMMKRIRSLRPPPPSDMKKERWRELWFSFV